MKERATLRDFLSQEHGLVRDYRLKVVTNLDNHNVDVVPGRASFVDPHTVKVEHPRRPPLLLSADVILIACGSRPQRPPQFDFDGGGIYNSNTFIRADCMPESLVGGRRRADRLRIRLHHGAAGLLGHPDRCRPRRSCLFSTPRWRACCRRA